GPQGPRRVQRPQRPGPGSIRVGPEGVDRGGAGDGAGSSGRRAREAAGPGAAPEPRRGPRGRRGRDSNPGQPRGRGRAPEGGAQQLPARPLGR
ncbi:hypothetical protein LEMLEM_LOCUS23515, partial [Lemmus lemmus]